MKFTPHLIVVVGTPGSGKDLLIRAINDLAIQHAEVIPKHTTRNHREDDGKEIICRGDKEYNIDVCDIRYHNYGNEYGVETKKIWEGLKRGMFQVVIISNAGAINQLKEIFGPLLVLVYVHSEETPESYEAKESSLGNDDGYVAKRKKNFRKAFELYLDNFHLFDHVLIYSGAAEDLYDQIFRLFQHYETVNPR